MSVSLRAESYDKDSIYIKERIVYETEVNLENNDSEGAMTDKWNKQSLHRESKLPTNFKAYKLIVPTSLIAIGVFGVYHHGFIRMNHSIADNMDNLRNTKYLHIDDYLQYLPAITYPTLGLISVPCSYSFKERIAIEASAYIVMSAVVNIGKYSFREKRPDSNARNSFPSGHSATVFTGAELMRIEYGWKIGLASYAVATGVAFLRLYNGRHWLNDVLAGAGIGILSAQIGYWMLPLYRKLFKWNTNTSNYKEISLIPSYSNRSFSLNLNLSY